MKIGYVTMLWPAASETFAARDVLALMKAGHEVEVMAMRPDNRKVEDLISSLGVTSVNNLRMNNKNQWLGLVSIFKNMPAALYLAGLLLRNERRLGALIRSFILFPAVFRLFDHIKKNEYEVVHLFWGHYPSMVGMLVAKYLQHIKLTQFLGPYDLQYNYALSSISGQKAQAVFTHAKSNVPALESIGIPANKINVVYRGIDITGMEITQGTPPASIIFIGRLIRAKGIFELLSVMQEIIQTHPTAKLTVIGDGEDRSEFETDINNRSLGEVIRLTGWLSPSEIKKYLSRSSVMLFLSHSERLPNAVKEAMACGIVPVSSKTEGIEELIADGVDGFIVTDIHDASAIAEKIITLIENPDLCAKMGEAARQKILENFDVNAAMARYIAVWSER